MVWVGLVCASCAARAKTPLDVAAAASLADVMGEFERAYEREHAGVDVRLSFAGSQVLRTQIEQGAPFDVFASADPEHIRALEGAGLVEAPQGFAASDLVILVPESNPAAIERFEDLPKAKRLVLGASDVPVGRYARAMLKRASAQLDPAFSSSVLARVVSEESSARLVRAKVELGEADAAVVYRADAIGATSAKAIEIPASLRAQASYEIGVIAGSERSDEATRFVQFVRSDAGREVLKTHGFVGAE